MSKDYTVDEETRKKLNELARHQLKHRILADIATDLSICKLENWDYKEYINDLIRMLQGLLNNAYPNKNF